MLCFELCLVVLDFALCLELLSYDGGRRSFPAGVGADAVGWFGSARFVPHRAALAASSLSLGEAAQAKASYAAQALQCHRGG